MFFLFLSKKKNKFTKDNNREKEQKQYQSAPKLLILSRNIFHKIMKNNICFILFLMKKALVPNAEKREFPITRLTESPR